MAPFFHEMRTGHERAAKRGDYTYDGHFLTHCQRLPKKGTWLLRAFKVHNLMDVRRAINICDKQPPPTHKHTIPVIFLSSRAAHLPPSKKYIKFSLFPEFRVWALATICMCVARKMRVFFLLSVAPPYTFLVNFSFFAVPILYGHHVYKVIRENRKYKKIKAIDDQIVVGSKTNQAFFFYNYKLNFNKNQQNWQGSKSKIQSEEKIETK